MAKPKVQDAIDKFDAGGMTSDELDLLLNRVFETGKRGDGSKKEEVKGSSGSSGSKDTGKKR